MKISRRNFKSLISAGLPLTVLIVALTGTTNTTIKMFLMASVLLLQFRRTLRLVDGTFFVLVFFVIAYAVVGIQNSDQQFVAYQIIGFPTLAYLLGKSCASQAPTGNFIVMGLVALGAAIALLPARVALGDIVAYGFAAGGRSLYVDGFGSEMSATVLGGLLTFGLSQSAASMSSAGLRNKVQFLAALVIASILITVALRLGTRTQILIFVICLLFGYLLNTSGRLAIWKKVGVGITAAALFTIAIGLLPGFLETDLGSYFRDRISDDRYGAFTVGGRSEKWMYSIESILVNPMGWSLSGEGYAHNMWLDVARVSGWFGLFAVLVFTATHLRAVHRSLQGVFEQSVKTSLLLAVLAANLLFMVEPIMDGFLYVFYAYCAVIGVANGVRQVPNVGGVKAYKVRTAGSTSNAQ